MFETAKKVLLLLSPAERRKLVVVLAIIVLMAFVNSVGIAAVFPLLVLLSKPETVHENAILRFAYEYGEFSSIGNFTIFVAVSVLIIFTGSIVAKIISNYVTTRFYEMRSFSISTKMLSGYMHRPYIWLLSQRSATLTQRTLGEVEQVVSASLAPLIQFFAQAMLVIGIVIALAVVDPLAALLGTGVLGGSYVAIFLAVRQQLSRLGEKRLAANRERFKTVKEAIGGFKDVKFLGLEDDVVSMFRGPARRYAEYRARSALIGQLPRHVLEMLAFGGMLAFIVAMLLRHDARLEDFVPMLGVYAFAGLRLFPAMQQLYQSLTQIRFSQAALDGLVADVQVFETEAERARNDAAPAMGMRVSLDLENVRFRYPGSDRPALDGVTLSIPARTIVGFVGGTGAGKTTVADVILGLLEPQEGRLVVDGAPIDRSNVHAWRRSIGYVPQTIFLTDDTVLANIAFGQPPHRIDRAAAERAAKAAALHDFIATQLPNGYDTLVGDNGVRLSGGQRQRIGIARALYRDPDILMLDEATSALDNLTERAVMEAVNDLGRSKTILMIAHRLSTVRRADRIIFFKGGRVAAQGSYDELLVDCEDFRRLATAADAA